MHMFSSLSRTAVLHAGKNSAWIISGKLLVFLLSFGFITFFANVASKETLGSYNYITSILAIVSIATLPGMNTAIVRASARSNDGSLVSIARKKFFYGLIGSFISLAISAWYFLHGNHILGYAFAIAAPLVPVTDTVSDLAFAYWIGKGAYKKSAVLSVWYQIGFSIPSFSLLFLTDNLLIIIFGVLSFQALSGFSVYRTIRIQNTIRDIESERFGFHLTVMSAFRIINIHSDKLLVWYLFGPVSLAIYTLALIPITKLEQLIPIEQLTLPQLSTKPISAYPAARFLKRMLILFLLLLIPVIVLFILSPYLYNFLFPDFKESIPLFRILLLTLLLTPIYILRSALTAWKMQKKLYLTEVLSPVFKIILCLVGGFFFGVAGVAIGVVVSRCLDSVVTYGVYRYTTI